MNPKYPEKPANEGKEEKGKLEKIANAIDPSGAEVSDDELIDPGANTKDFPVRQNETNRNSSKPR